MDLSALLTLESSTDTGIHLYLEGIFWKAYEQSAWRFVRHVCSYKPMKRHIKSLGQDVVTLGFPSAGLQKVLEQTTYTQTDPKHILVTCEDTGTPEEFEQWKTAIPLQPPTEKSLTRQAASASVSPGAYAQIISELERFDVLHASPMDCMQFIASLKQQLTNH